MQYRDITEDEIRDAYSGSDAFTISDDNNPDIFFEHDRWWLRTDDGQTERAYSVVICRRQNCAYDELDFELLDEVEY